jgi:hypothetical protein
MGTTRRFNPAKYYKGLTRKQKVIREKEIKSHAKRNFTKKRAYTPFYTDTLVKTKPSSYSEQWKKLFPDAKSLDQRAAASGVPKRFLQESYNRGMAAWRTGHRPGATQQQWGFARVSSMLVCGKTYYTADADIVERAKKASKTARKWFSRCSK